MIKKETENKENNHEGKTEKIREKYDIRNVYLQIIKG